MKYIQTNSWS